MENLPPGFRFYPTEEELVSFYLHNKLEGNRHDIDRAIKVVDIYNIEPWHLPKFAGELCHGDTEQWFFFTRRQEREVRGGRPNRTTASGYWKATGSPGYVYSQDNRVIGVKKSMVFYQGRAQTGKKTNWKMNEYRAIEVAAKRANISTPKLRHEFSLCRVYIVSGSVRAFDRRPLETTTDAEHKENQAGTSSQTTTTLENTSSPETLYLEEDHAGRTDVATNNDWDMNNGIEQPLWEWEQLNWI